MTCEPARHSSLWFDDGNVVLLASTDRLDPPGLLFRIHKSILSKHSEVFRDMFTLPTSEDRWHSSEDQNETYDGTALIRMPDTAEQIEAMLKAFYEPLYLEFDNRNPDLPLQLTPLMTMVRKYEIKEIGSHLENRFKAAWPKTLEEWDEIDLILSEMRVAGPLIAWPRSLLPEPASAIVFAKQFGVDCILAAAFYDLSRCSYYQEWPSDPDAKFNPQEKGARWNLLSAQDLLKLGQLKETLKSKTMKSSLLSARILCRKVSACEGDSRETCQPIIENLIDTIMQIPEQVHCHDILRSLWWTSGELKDQCPICDSCSEVFATKLYNVRIGMWDQILNVVHSK